MSSPTFYRCSVCGNIVEVINDSGVTPVCCGEEMCKLEAAKSDGKIEFHVPVFKLKGNIVEVKVGENPHPMEKDHYIQWIEIVTTHGIQRKCLKCDDVPKACFSLMDGEKVCEIYSYCNKHFLFKCKGDYK